MALERGTTGTLGLSQGPFAISCTSIHSVRDLSASHGAGREIEIGRGVLEEVSKGGRQAGSSRQWSKVPASNDQPLDIPT